MKRTLIITFLIACLCCISCTSSNNKRSTYLDRDISTYVHTGEWQWQKICLDKVHHTFTHYVLYVNEHTDWKQDYQGSYYEEQKGENEIVCNLSNNEDERLGTIRWVTINLSSDSAVLKAISGEFPAHYSRDAE